MDGKLGIDKPSDNCRRGLTPDGEEPGALGENSTPKPSEDDELVWQRTVTVRWPNRQLAAAANLRRFQFSRALRAHLRHQGRQQARAIR